MPALKDAKRNIDDIRFSRVAFGYKSSEVDNFIDDLQRKIEEAITEREELMSLVDELRHKISDFQREKDAITRAILNSEKIAQASVIDAGVKSKYILKDASEKASQMLKSATNEYERKINEAKKIGQDVEIFVNECIQKLGTQIESMKAFNKIAVSSLDMKNFQIDPLAQKFVSDDLSPSHSAQIFSDGSKTN